VINSTAVSSNTSTPHHDLDVNKSKRNSGVAGNTNTPQNSGIDCPEQTNTTANKQVNTSTSNSVTISTKHNSSVTPQTSSIDATDQQANVASVSSLSSSPTYQTDSLKESSSALTTLMIEQTLTMTPSSLDDLDANNNKISSSTVEKDKVNEKKEEDGTDDAEVKATPRKNQRVVKVNNDGNDSIKSSRSQKDVSSSTGSSSKSKIMKKKGKKLAKVQGSVKSVGLTNTDSKKNV
jgi:hypothetical protein